MVDVDTWRTIELTFDGSSGEPADPLRDLVVDGVFRHESGIEITRPMFWDGGATWRLRFAPTVPGRWVMSTRVSVGEDNALSAAAADITAVPYDGAHEIFRRGFLRVAPNGRHFEYADGTPFFYLGDTHWVLPHERLDTSNAPGVASQFTYLVDLRVAQKFTVYQSEPIWQPHREWAEPHERHDEMPVANLSDGFDADDLPGFRQLDRKFAYIADAGLVHANAQITWAKDPAEHPEIYTVDYMERLARYWLARYGSYPVIWTIAQEIDKNMYDAYDCESIGVWHAVGRTLAEQDAYGQVIMPHLENTTHTRVADSSWKDLAFHAAFGMQVQEWDVEPVREFWDENPSKPAVLYETRYENFWTDARGALGAGYRALQLGMCGYGYGVAGVWNDVYSLPEDDPDFGTDYELPRRYQWWYDGARRETADALAHFRQFYESRRWWLFEPRFHDPEWSDLRPEAYLSSDGDERFILFVTGAAADSGDSPGELRRMRADAGYRAEWFDPRTGESVDVGQVSVALDGSWAVPAAPTRDDWVLTIDRG